jgi:hypothetical protein
MMDACRPIVHGKIVTHCVRMVGFLLLLVLADTAYPQISHEPQLKAVFVYNFAQFTEWPADAFSGPRSPLVIGVFGDDPVEDYLRQAVKGESVNGRTVVVQHFGQVNDIKDCHILFTSRAEERHWRDVVETLQGKSVLTVSDIDNFTQNGGMIGLCKVNNKLRLKVNPEATKVAHLNISSKLLRAAEIDSEAKGKK